MGAEKPMGSDVPRVATLLGLTVIEKVKCASVSVHLCVHVCAFVHAFCMLSLGVAILSVRKVDQQM